MHAAPMSDRCRSNGNDHLSNFNTLRETTCLPSHTAYSKDNMTCCELSHVSGENQRSVLHDETLTFFILTPLFKKWFPGPPRLDMGRRIGRKASFLVYIYIVVYSCRLPYIHMSFVGLEQCLRRRRLVRFVSGFVRPINKQVTVGRE